MRMCRVMSCVSIDHILSPPPSYTVYMVLIVPSHDRYVYLYLSIIHTYRGALAGYGFVLHQPWVGVGFMINTLVMIISMDMIEERMTSSGDGDSDGAAVTKVSSSSSSSSSNSSSSSVSSSSSLSTTTTTRRRGRPSTSKRS